MEAYNQKILKMKLLMIRCMQPRKECRLAFLKEGQSILVSSSRKCGQTTSATTGWGWWWAGCTSEGCSTTWRPLMAMGLSTLGKLQKQSKEWTGFFLSIIYSEPEPEPELVLELEPEVPADSQPSVSRLLIIQKISQSQSQRSLTTAKVKVKVSHQSLSWTVSRTASEQERQVEPAARSDACAEIEACIRRIKANV